MGYSTIRRAEGREAKLRCHGRDALASRRRTAQLLRPALLSALVTVASPSLPLLQAAPAAVSRAGPGPVGARLQADVQATTGERSFPGVLMPARTALIKSRQNEQIAEVEVKQGGRVEQGELLLRFVDDQERVEVQRAEALRDRAQAEFERIRRLHERDQISDDVLEEKETALRLAQAELELSRIRLAELSILAPFDGVVAERYVDPGASVEDGDPLLRVTALRPLRVEAVLPEELLPRLRTQTHVEVTVNSGATSLRLPLDLGPVVVDPASNTFLLQIEIPNEDEELIPGVSCSISLPGG